jgi:hypothetical protein
MIVFWENLNAEINARETRGMDQKSGQRTTRRYAAFNGCARS